MNERAILVLGGTGTIGRRLVARLRDAGAPVRAASRHGDVRFDWSAPQTWEPALDGADRLHLMAPDGVPVDPALVSLAVESGVRRIVLLSSRGIEAMGDQRLLDAEATVRGSGAEWTILRADWFDQNFDEGFFRPAVLAGELAMPLGDLRQAFVDACDIAAVAAAALTGDGHGGRRYDVTGPRALSFGEAVAIIGRVARRTVAYLGSDDDYLAQQEALGVPREAAEGALAAFTALREQGHAEPSDDVRRVTGRAPLSFETYAAGAAAAGAWSG
ncbi:NAD(P)H-binding protein [Jiangella rhizosphaerae]|uniref:NmrA family transcriptional regulator n=1 Tax=Jiangella rhizosphaerae TaxID=2293569 RepID=A0A418KGY2_9ACTN|nr:NAD(P)H-binding protein [Jiangella rhizosphaerae]RIQ11203.1 NmrA family transcriptional regulator [Jiangella rhizosphaerae]